MLLITKLLKFQQRSPQEFPQWFLFRKRDRENVFRSNVLVRVVGNKWITPRKKRNVGWISVKCSSCSRSWKLVGENSFKISPRKTILPPALHVSFLVLFFFSCILRMCHAQSLHKKRSVHKEKISKQERCTPCVSYRSFARLYSVRVIQVLAFTVANTSLLHVSFLVYWSCVTHVVTYTVANVWHILCDTYSSKYVSFTRLFSCVMILCDSYGVLEHCMAAFVYSSTLVCVCVCMWLCYSSTLWPHASILDDPLSLFDTSFFLREDPVWHLWSTWTLCGRMNLLPTILSLSRLHVSFRVWRVSLLRHMVYCQHFVAL